MRMRKRRSQRNTKHQIQKHNEVKFLHSFFVLMSLISTCSHPTHSKHLTTLNVPHKTLEAQRQSMSTSRQAAREQDILLQQHESDEKRLRWPQSISPQLKKELLQN